MSLSVGSVSGELEFEDSFSDGIEKAIGVTVSALEDAQKEMDAAAKKGQEVDTILKDLGVSYEVYAAALQKANAEQFAAAQAMDALQVEASKMNDAVDKAAAEMNKAQDEALRMNEAFDRTHEGSSKLEAVFEALAHGSIKDLIGAFVELPASLLLVVEVAMKAVESLVQLGEAVEALYGKAEKLSNKSLITGFSTDDLQKYTRAAQVAGGNLDSLTTAFQRFQKQIEGSGRALKQLGIDQNAFKAASSAEQLQMLIDKVFSYKTASEQSAASQVAFGRSGANLLPTLKAINDGIGETATVIGPKAVEAMAQMDDALDILKGTWADLKEQGLAVVALALTDLKPLIEAVTLGIKGMIPFVVEVVGAFANMAVTVGTNVMNVIRGFVEAITGVVSSGGLMLQTLKEMATGAISVGDGMKTLQLAAQGGLSAVVEGMGKASSVTFQWKDYSAELAAKLGDVDKGAHGVAETVSKEWVKAFDKAKKAVEDTWAALDKIQSDAFRKLQSGQNTNMVGSMLGDLPSVQNIGRDIETTIDQGIGAAGNSGIVQKNIEKMIKQGFNREMIQKQLMSALQIDAKTADIILGPFKDKLKEPFHINFEMAVTGAAELAGQLFGGNASQIVSGLSQSVGNYHDQMEAAQNSTDKFNAKVELAANAASMLGNVLSSSTNPSIQKMGGALSGAASGAKIGTAILPGWGTAIGAIAGGIAGFVMAGQKMIKQINDQRDAFIAQHGGWEQLQKDIARAGSQEDLLKKLFDAKTPQSYADAMKEIDQVLNTWNDAQNGLNDAIERYGITVDELGPKFAQQKMDEQAGQLIQDFQLLTAAGVDVNTVIEKMGPSLVDFVNQSIAAGTTIPEAMRPVIEQLIASGQLLDENGEAYTSVEDAGITFAQTMDEKFTTLIDKITQMVNALLGIPTDINTNVNVHTNYSQTGNAPGGGDNGGDTGPYHPGNHYEHNAAGGIVTTPGWSMVAERGPEAIIPVGELSRMGGGSQADFQAMLFSFGRAQQKSMTTAIRDALLKTRG